MFIWVDGGGARRPPGLWRRQRRRLHHRRRCRVRCRCCCRCHRPPPPPPPPSSPPLRHVTLGEGARERGGIVRIGGRGLGRRWARRKWVFRCPVHANTHEFAAKKKTRQNSRDAVAWASYAPMRLHRQNRRGGMPKLPIIARSEPNGGGGGNEQNGQESAPPEVSLAQNRFLVFGLRFGKRGKPQKGLRKKKKKRQTARP